MSGLIDMCTEDFKDSSEELRSENVDLKEENRKLRDENDYLRKLLLEKGRSCGQ
jgi:cell division protein FtsB